MDLPKIDIMTMPALPTPTGLFAVQRGGESMSDDTMTAVMAYLYEMKH